MEKVKKEKVEKKEKAENKEKEVKKAHSTAKIAVGQAAAAPVVSVPMEDVKKGVKPVKVDSVKQEINGQPMKTDDAVGGLEVTGGEN